MPRLIPRLLRALNHARIRPPRTSRRLPFQPPPVQTPRAFTRPEEVDISPNGRTKSILLDRKALRLIYRHARYERSKGLAPYVYVSKARWKAKQMRGRAPLGVIPREMTKEERSFYANPYLRMLGSPLRQCYQTGWTLPRELMIRMTPMLLPGGSSERPECMYLPSGLEHPACTRFQGGRSSYLLCYKPVVEFVRQKGSYRRFMPEGVTVVPMHPLVCQQIGHLLRVRVLQELHMIARRLLRRRRSAKPDEPPLLRRLTRAEWADIKTSGVVPHKNAVAVLVVPPPNKDPETKTRPTPAATSAPDPDALSLVDTPNGLPICVMYPTTAEEWRKEDHALPDTVPPARVPLYNGVPLFPSRTQRAALHAALGEVLRAERTSRLGSGSAPFLAQENGVRNEGVRAKGDQKASHAILVCSDEKTILRGDTVPLAIALWRLRMWEGDVAEDCFVDWMADPKQTI